MNQEKFKVKDYSNDIHKPFTSYVLGIDVGGTNTNIGFAGLIKSKPFLLNSFSFHTDEIKNLTSPINQVLDYIAKKKDINIQNACISAAGPINENKDYVKLTNSDFEIRLKDIITDTSLKSTILINDFEAIGYGTNFLNNTDFKIIRQGKEEDNKFLKAIIGAGTGLGKSILIYNKENKIYYPIPSEGGHADFPIYNNFEFELIDYLKNLRSISNPLTYEEVLSGRGLEGIYSFIIQEQDYKQNVIVREIEKSNNKANLISKYKETDKNCEKAFKIFTKFYGRCAKNFLLDTMALGGLYIAGGIASKNSDIFNYSEFLKEFDNAFRRSDLLKNVPIKVITNYDVSLYGSCFAAFYKK